ncbi:MAG: serine/threonine protein kinase [Parcubacteria group bacterium Gr01-1014_20]|nr:MAG: serine/threonine protein kinase [Parcubacteria group bacterium Gr01-1014_20]
MPKPRSPRNPTNKDHYGILEVNPRASQEVIKAAFHALMKVHHPDKHGDETLARKITIAYEILGDPDKRATYDETRKVKTGTMIGNYRVIEKIAEGGFGTTYLGEHAILQEPVCIKHCGQVDPQHDSILIEEAKSIWNLRHYGLPVMQNLERLPDGSLALVMTYVPGKTLRKVVDKVGRLEAEHVAWITERILNVLKYLHFNGVVHGDLKPDNIIVQHESHMVVLVDFGLAMVKPTSKSTAKGFTEFFAPPEQLAGLALIPESDFYSLGMTMLYALSGNLKSLERKEVPSDVPDPLCDFIRKLITRDPMSRPRWENVDLFAEIQKVREQSFGRSRSGMKPIPGA